MSLVPIVFLLMLVEQRLSRANERSLRAQGAFEPRDDVYRVMAWSYPASFLLMALEGAIVGPPPEIVFAAGVLVFAAAKAIKYWAIASLGPRWTFHVLVLPGAPLVARGPYAWLRHPNYVGVMGELVGVALALGAPVTGIVTTIGFSYLLRQRIAVENRALGRDQPSAKGV